MKGTMGHIQLMSQQTSGSGYTSLSQIYFYLHRSLFWEYVWDLRLQLEQDSLGGDRDVLTKLESSDMKV
jgi:hypothetical protein